MTKTKRILTAAALVALSGALAACGGATDSGEQSADAAQPQSTTGDSNASQNSGSWPRVIDHAAGTTTIDSQPMRIVSVSPSITGSLLAIDAPLTASAAAAVTGMTTEDGFFLQWADVAKERGVEIAYPNMELDLDAVDALAPDLIIGSASGGDTTLDSYDQLSEIAPTVLLDYSSQSWQDLMGELGTMTGNEERAEATLADYDSWVSQQADKIVLPEQPVTAAVYLGADGMWAFADNSPQADLLTSLGFTYVNPDDAYVTPESVNAPVRIVTAENLVPAFSPAKSLFSVDMGTPDLLETLKSDPLLAAHPAIGSDRVYDLGTAAFRLDYYAAKDTVEKLVETFGN